MRATSTTVAPRAAAIFAATSPMPLDAPAITITWSRTGFRVNAVGTSSADRSVVQDALGERAHPVADAVAERLGRRLMQEVERAALVHDLRV